MNREAVPSLIFNWLHRRELLFFQPRRDLRESRQLTTFQIEQITRAWRAIARRRDDELVLVMIVVDHVDLITGQFLLDSRQHLLRLRIEIFPLLFPGGVTGVRENLSFFRK